MGAIARPSERVAEFGTRWSSVKWRAPATPLAGKRSATAGIPEVRIFPMRTRSVWGQSRAKRVAQRGSTRVGSFLTEFQAIETAPVAKLGRWTFPHY